MTAHAQLLQKVPVFGGIREDTLDFLLQKAKSLSLDKGNYLYKEGDKKLAMYVIEKGEIAILKTRKGQQYFLNQAGTGESIGEMALFDLFPHSASTYALSDCQVLEISSKNLFEVYQKDLEQFALIQMNMGREVARRLRISDQRLFEYQMKNEIQEGNTHLFQSSGSESRINNGLPPT